MVTMVPSPWVLLLADASQLVTMLCRLGVSGICSLMQLVSEAGMGIITSHMLTSFSIAMPICSTTRERKKDEERKERKKEGKKERMDEEV